MAIARPLGVCGRELRGRRVIAWPGARLRWLGSRAVWRRPGREGDRGVVAGQRKSPVQRVMPGAGREGGPSRAPRPPSAGVGSVSVPRETISVQANAGVALMRDAAPGPCGLWLWSASTRCRSAPLEGCCEDEHRRRTLVPPRRYRRATVQGALPCCSGHERGRRRAASRLGSRPDGGAGAGLHRGRPRRFFRARAFPGDPPGGPCCSAPSADARYRGGQTWQSRRVTAVGGDYQYHSRHTSRYAAFGVWVYSGGGGQPAGRFGRRARPCASSPNARLNQAVPRRSRGPRRGRLRGRRRTTPPGSGPGRPGATRASACGDPSSAPSPRRSSRRGGGHRGH